MAVSAPVRKKFLLATIDLGAHSCRMLIAECDPKTRKLDVLEDLNTTIPLGSDVFRHGEVSDGTIRMLCGIFANLRRKMDEYGVRNYRAIATSAVREASNAGILLERIRHATGIEVKVFEGTDEARLNYLSVMNVLPKDFDFHRKSSLIADIGTGACQISSFEGGAFCFTETIKLGTLRVLDQMPGAMSAEGIRKYLTPVIDKAFTELEQIAPDIKANCVFAMGSSVRTLLALFHMREGKGDEVRKIRRKDFEEKLQDILEMSLENISDRYGISPDAAEMVIPCAIILEELFRITGASALLVPTVSLKMGLLIDFRNELLHQEDGFARQIEEMVRRTAEKYRADNDYTHRTALFADKLFIQLQDLHGCPARTGLLLRIAALLHKTGLFINNQAYHKHSYYIINSTEIPGISPQERAIAALTARYHRKNVPELHHPEFAALPDGDKETVRKLSALLRVACGLAGSCRSVMQFQVKMEKDRVVVVPSQELQMTGFSIPLQDIAYFKQVFAVPLMIR